MSFLSTKNNEKSRIIFFLIVFLAIALRIWDLGSIPPSPSIDEVSLGYNAFSILRTGADEYGEKFPILLRAYDDWRPALYVYTIAPFIPLFGLSALAVRLPSVILSILSVVTVYFLVFELLSYKKKSFTLDQKKYISLLVMLLVAISPWHVYFSRIGHEWNGALSFFIFGFYFFLKYVNSISGNMPRKTILLLPLSALCMGLSFDFYQSSKIFIPLFIGLISLLFLKDLLKNKKNILFALMVGILVSLPILFASLSPNALIRFNGTNIFAGTEDLFYESAQKVLEAKENNDIVGQILHNRRLIYVTVPFSAFISHLSIPWLFFNSGTESFKVPGYGLLYIFELPFILLGIIFLVLTRRVDTRVKVLLFFWGLFSIIPASITTGYPHASRIYNIFPLVQIVGALGFFVSYDYLRKNTGKYFPVGVSVVLGGVILFFVARFAYSYFYLFPHNLSYQFQAGAYEAIKNAERYEDQYTKIVVSNRDGFFESYMFYLFLEKYDPKKYQNKGGTGSGGFAIEHTIGKYEFRNILEEKDFRSNTLYISNPGEIDKSKAVILEKVYFPNGVEAAWILRGVQE